MTQNPIRTGAYASRPTLLTEFLRTFLPWQLVRFAVINLRMLRMLSKSR